MSEFSEKVKKYFGLDQSAKRLEKMKKPLNMEIKTTMRNTGIYDTVIDDIKIMMKTQERVKLNEEKLVTKLKELGLTQAIATVEKPNQSVIEDLIWNKQLNPAVLEDCVEKTVVETLTVKKASAKDMLGGHSK